MGVTVDHLSFAVEKGQIYGFLGPNGAGKSTTMNIITGYLSATEGTVLIDGHDIFGARGGQTSYRVPARDSSSVSGYESPGVSEICRGAERRPKKKTAWGKWSGMDQRASPRQARALQEPGSKGTGRWVQIRLRPIGDLTDYPGLSAGGANPVCDHRRSWD